MPLLNLKSIKSGEWSGSRKYGQTKARTALSPEIMSGDSQNVIEERKGFNLIVKRGDQTHLNEFATVGDEKMSDG